MKAEGNERICVKLLISDLIRLMMSSFPSQINFFIFIRTGLFRWKIGEIISFVIHD